MPSPDDYSVEAGTVIPDRLARALFVAAELDDTRRRFPGTPIARVITAIEAGAKRHARSVAGTSRENSSPDPAHSLSTRTAAAALGITERGVLAAIHRGTLTATQEHGRWIITPTDLDLYAQTRSRTT